MFLSFFVNGPLGDQSLLRLWERLRSIVKSTSVSLSVCLSVCPRGYLRNHTRDLYQMFVHVACGRDSILLRRRCDTLCTSGVVDDIVFYFYNGPYSGMNFATTDRFPLNLLIYRRFGHNSISCC